MEWTLSAKNEQYEEDQNRCFYVFVSLINEKCNKNRYYIVPAKRVATEIKDGHEQWLKTPGRKGQKHNENTIRKFIIDESEPESNFEALGLDD